MKVSMNFWLYIHKCNARSFSESIDITVLSFRTRKQAKGVEGLRYQSLGEMLVKWNLINAMECSELFKHILVRTSWQPVKLFYVKEFCYDFKCHEYEEDKQARVKCRGLFNSVWITNIWFVVLWKESLVTLM